MNLKALGVVAAALCTAGCPSGTLFTSISARGGSGGGAGAERLVFSVQPSAGTHGNIITPPIQVTVLDTLNTPDSSFSHPVSVVIINNPTGATLTGTTSVVPFNGISVFGDLAISLGPATYVLQASAQNATAITSSSFFIQ